MHGMAGAAAADVVAPTLPFVPAADVVALTLPFVTGWEVEPVAVLTLALTPIFGEHIVPLTPVLYNGQSDRQTHTHRHGYRHRHKYTHTHTVCQRL